MPNIKRRSQGYYFIISKNETIFNLILRDKACAEQPSHWAAMCFTVFVNVHSKIQPNVGITEESAGLGHIHKSRSLESPVLSTSVGSDSSSWMNSQRPQWTHMNKTRQEMKFKTDVADQWRGVSNRKCWSLWMGAAITEDILSCGQDSVVTWPFQRTLLRRYLTEGFPRLLFINIHSPWAGSWFISDAIQDKFRTYRRLSPLKKHYPKTEK